MSRAKQVGGIAAVVIALAASFMAPWEGTKYRPYQDVIGVWTVCRGITGKEVVIGKLYTEAECQALEAPVIAKSLATVKKCLPVPLSNNQAAALTSLVFNTGPKSVCGSTLQRKALAGDYAGMCREFDKWAYAGGKRWRGLEKRRAAERALCEKPDA